MLKGTLLFVLAYVIHRVNGIYIAPDGGVKAYSPFAPNPMLRSRMYIPRQNAIIIPRFISSKYPVFLTNQRFRKPFLTRGHQFSSSLTPRSDLTSFLEPENLSLEMMREIAPFKKMDAFGNVVIYEGRDGERVLYRPPTEKLLVNSYYLPYYNKYIAAEHMMRLQRQRVYNNRYSYLNSRFLNGLYSYPYDDLLINRRKIY